MDRPFRLALSIVSIVWLAACGSNSSGSTLTTPTSTATLATDTFTGSIDQNGTAMNGSYCVRIYDAGNIPAGVTASYTVQVQHY